jgi:hypothetical protein
MRYLVAIVFAILLAGAATLFVSSPVASFIVSRQAFESPDDVSAMEDLIFMIVNLIALVIGWTLGWWIGGLLSKPERPI